MTQDRRPTSRAGTCGPNDKLPDRRSTDGTIRRFATAKRGGECESEDFLCWRRDKLNRSPIVLSAMERSAPTLGDRGSERKFFRPSSGWEFDSNNLSYARGRKF
jgi:hypothetical protein